jgi:hypothetical protein
MKNLTLILFIALSFGVKSQTSFVWDFADTTSRTKTQLYSDIKLFVASYWKSANNVIQNDDKEAGVILLKGSHTKTVRFMMVDYVYTYGYMITFKMKDNKFKIVLDNVGCADAYCTATNSSTLQKIEPFTDPKNCPPTGTFEAPGPPARKVVEMMDGLNNDLYTIVIDFMKFMKVQKTKKDEW